jgi:predicted ATP-grasp superfamily ATP-dependent carboligase
MRLFVYEWTCCVADAPASLRCEGWAMLRAVLDDLQRVPGIHPVTLLHETFTQQTACETYHVSTADHLDRFGDLACGADGTLVIAPESNNILLDLAVQVEEAGGRLLGPTSKAIALAGDKYHLGQWWLNQGIPTPALACLTGDVQRVRFPAVLKPRDGAGSTATFLVRRPEDLTDCLDQAQAEGHVGEFVVQDYARGQPASVAFLIGPAGTMSLVPAAQHLGDNGRFRYEGGSLPLKGPLGQRAMALGSSAVNAVPGLGGYVGVDLVLGAAEDGRQDYALEINPRLTTSYVGLRMLAETNLADAMIGVLRGERPEVRWRRQNVAFGPDGSVVIGPNV